MKDFEYINLISENFENTIIPKEHVISVELGEVIEVKGLTSYITKVSIEINKGFNEIINKENTETNLSLFDRIKFNDVFGITFKHSNNTFSNYLVPWNSDDEFTNPSMTTEELKNGNLLIVIDNEV